MIENINRILIYFLGYLLLVKVVIHMYLDTTRGVELWSFIPSQLPFRFLLKYSEEVDSKHEWLKKICNIAFLSAGICMGLIISIYLISKFILL